MSRQDNPPHRLVIEIDRNLYKAFRGHLLTESGQTVSDWGRNEIVSILSKAGKLPVSK